MGSSSPSQPQQAAVQIPTNNKAAETSAQTTAAAPPPAPVLTVDTSTPDSLDLIKQRAAQEVAKKGRNFLAIPLTGGNSGGYSGISIPR